MRGTAGLVTAVIGSAGTLAHHRMADDQRGAFALCFGLFQGLTNGVGVVTVNLYHTPAPSFVLTGSVLGRYLLGLGGELNIVRVEEHDQIVQTQRTSHAASALRNLLLNAAVRDVGIDGLIHHFGEAGFHELGGNGCSYGKRMALAQRT